MLRFCKKKIGLCTTLARFFREVSPSGYLGQMEGLAEIQNLYIQFVILKVRNSLLETISRGTLYVI